MVTGYWIDTLVSGEETASQVVVIFEHALEREGLVDLLTDERLDLAIDDPRRAMLLAVSDNGPQMTAQDTRAFMTLMAIAQHHGRPHTPTDQAWIESFFGHVKGEWPISKTSPIPSCSTLSSPASASTTTRCVYTKRSATHPRRRTPWPGEAIREA